MPLCIKASLSYHDHIILPYEGICFSMIQAEKLQPGEKSL